MKIVIDIPNSLYANLKKIQNGSIACKRILELVKNGKPYEERLQGKWIEHYDSSDGFTWLTCSRCMFKAYEEDYNFCPNCGVEMRKEKKDG